MYIIVKRVSESLHHHAVVERVDLAVLHSGDFFGEMSFLTGTSRTAPVETVEDSDISHCPYILEVLRSFSDMRLKGTTAKILELNKQ